MANGKLRHDQRWFEAVTRAPLEIMDMIDQVDDESLEGHERVAGGDNRFIYTDPMDRMDLEIDKFVTSKFWEDLNWIALE